jgi:hypothetical protein
VVAAQPSRPAPIILTPLITPWRQTACRNIDT